MKCFSTFSMTRELHPFKVLIPCVQLKQPQPSCGQVGSEGKAVTQMVFEVYRVLNKGFKNQNYFWQNS